MSGDYPVTTVGQHPAIPVLIGKTSHHENYDPLTYNGQYDKNPQYISTEALIDTCHLLLQSNRVEGIPCKDCDKLFPSKKHLERHSKTTHQKKFQCDICYRPFGRSEHLKDHLENVHSNTRSYPCTICNKMYKSVKHLKNHTTSVHHNKTFFCSICSKTFTKKTNLNVHVRVHKDILTGMNYKCQICEKGFRAKKYLSAHVHKVHTDIKFECPECPGKLYKKKFDLKKHMKTAHLELKKGRCNICGRDFETDEMMQEHIANDHKGFENALGCPKCNKVFKTSRYLKVHLGRAHGVRCKQFQCKYCHLDFMKAADYRVHMSNSHADLLKQEDDKKKLQCDICKKKFLNKNRISIHMVKYHVRVQKSYRCKDCDNALFKTYHRYKNHRRSMHPRGKSKRHSVRKTRGRNQTEFVDVKVESDDESYNHPLLNVQVEIND